MNSISFYNERGEITGSTSANEDTLAVTKQHAPFPWVDGEHDPATMYVNNGEAVARPVQATILDGTTLMHLPVPCVIEINGTEYECDDDTAELVFDQHATYNIVVRAWPYQDKEFTYENNP